MSGTGMRLWHVTGNETALCEWNWNEAVACDWE